MVTAIASSRAVAITSSFVVAIASSLVAAIASSLAVTTVQPWDIVEPFRQFVAFNCLAVELLILLYNFQETLQ